MKYFACSTGVIALIISFILLKPSYKNNVCKTFEDYYSNRDQNKNCYYNPDGELTTPEIIKRWGYSLETHQLTTEDGYTLTMYRIPHGKSSPTRKLGKPILVQHGHKSSSKSFVITGEKSLAFILANEGYDVWLGNFRGTVDSRNHVHLNESSIEYWDFSFHELGVYDVAAQVNYVSELRKQKIIYIGYSLGTTAATVYSAIYPEMAENKVKIFIQLAPYIITSGMGRYSYYGLTLWNYIVPYIYNAINGQDIPQSYINKVLSDMLCHPYPFQMKICHIPNMFPVGFSFDQINPETFPITTFYPREIASAKTTTHASQMVVTEEFRHFDHGSEENLKRYGSQQPPPYNITNLRVPMYMVCSENDKVSAKKGVEKFYASLPQQVKRHGMYIVEHDEFNHLDFLWGKDVVPLLYDHLVKFISNI